GAPTTLVAAAGVAWGIFETLQTQAGVPLPQAPTTPEGSAGVAVPPPPLPDVGAPAVPADALRMIRLAISASSADGTLGEKERAAVLEQARAAGAEHLVGQGVQQRRAVAQGGAGGGQAA